MSKIEKGIFSKFKFRLIPEQEKTRAINNQAILEELFDCFENSCHHESVGSSLLFNTHFIIILHPDMYEERLASLPVVVKEAVKSFYRRLSELKKNYEDISPVSSTWHFKFGPGVEFNQEKITPNDIKIIGMLTGLKESLPNEPESLKNVTARVTMKSKTTNVYDKMDINLQSLRHINFLQNGTFSVKFNSDLRMGDDTASARLTSTINGFAEIECYMADKNLAQSYVMRDKEIVIARKELENQAYSNYFLIDSKYVSNPHARIRVNDASGKFQIASFSRNETRVNEKVIDKSEPGNPQWFDLDNSSQILLNSIVTLKFKSIY